MPSAKRKKELGDERRARSLRVASLGTGLYRSPARHCYIHLGWRPLAPRCRAIYSSEAVAHNTQRCSAVTTTKGGPFAKRFYRLLCRPPPRQSPRVPTASARPWPKAETYVHSFTAPSPTPAMPAQRRGTPRLHHSVCLASGQLRPSSFAPQHIQQRTNCPYPHPPTLVGRTF